MSSGQAPFEQNCEYYFYILVKKKNALIWKILINQEISKRNEGIYDILLIIPSL